jgi:hypothetical protein
MQMRKNPFPPGHILAHLVVSDAPENIYYADLFQIENRNWMIQGYGKTTAARIASGKVVDAMYATDAVAIIRDGSTIFGRYDPGALSPNSDDLHKLHRLDAIAYCLNEEQTEKAYRPRGGVRTIVEADAKFLSNFCAIYPYPAYSAIHFFTEDELAHLANPLRMENRFLELTQDVVGTKFLIVPYMNTVEEKAALYSSYLF